MEQMLLNSPIAFIDSAFGSLLVAAEPEFKQTALVSGCFFFHMRDQNPVHLTSVNASVVTWYGSPSVPESAWTGDECCWFTQLVTVV